MTLIQFVVLHKIFWSGILTPFLTYLQNYALPSGKCAVLFPPSNNDKNKNLTIIVAKI